jgi:hypothetical protein
MDAMGCHQRLRTAYGMPRRREMNASVYVSVRSGKEIGDLFRVTEVSALVQACSFRPERLDQTFADAAEAYRVSAPTSAFVIVRICPVCIEKCSTMW